MQMFRRIIFVAGLAGLIAGVLLTALQMSRAIPLILEAEVYEATAASGQESEGAPAAPAAQEALAPSDGFERTFSTLVFNIVMSVGYALLLAAGFALTGQSGWRKGLYWGAAGFVSFVLAPGIGLPAEVPGALAAPLLDRQLWWLGTVMATGGGLALMFLVRTWQWVAVGAILIVLPHVIGAPQSAEQGGLTPESLARQFVIAVLVSSFLFWLALGTLSGFFYKRFAAA